MRRITIRERGRLHRLKSGRLPGSEGADAAWLDAKVFDRLSTYDRARPDGSVFTWGPEEARAGQWVGVIQMPGLSLEILPKIDGESDADVDLARDNLLSMLADAGDVPLRSRDLASLGTRRAPLHETLMALFARRLLAELLRGPDRAYVGEEAELPALRGKLLLGRHSARNAARRERFSCAYEEFSIDTALGRILRASCRRLLGLACCDATREALGHCLLLLDDVADVPDARHLLARVSLNRQNERFADSLAFCRIVLAELAPTARAGDAATFSILFDMDRVFEGFVAGFLRRRVLPNLPGTRAFAQARSRRRFLMRTDAGHGALSLKPDLLIEAPAGRLVVDTKWKRLGALTQRRQAGVGADDLYQLFAYTRRFEVKRSILLYPWTVGATEREFHVLGDGGVADGSTVCVRFLDLGHNLQKSAGRAHVAEQLRSLLARHLEAA